MELGEALFNDWNRIWRTLLVGALAYVVLIGIIRVSGKRTLASMNAFDFIVTIALGSTLATIVLSGDAALAEGVTAFIVLVGLQLIITWLSVRTRLVPKLVKSTPSLLALEGRMRYDALQNQRVSEVEVLQAIRQRGHGSLESVFAVILETDGSFSVIGDRPPRQPTSLANVSGWDEASLHERQA